MDKITLAVGGLFGITFAFGDTFEFDSTFALGYDGTNGLLSSVKRLPYIALNIIFYRSTGTRKKISITLRSPIWSAKRWFGANRNTYNTVR